MFLEKDVEESGESENANNEKRTFTEIALEKFKFIKNPEKL